MIFDVCQWTRFFDSMCISVSSLELTQEYAFSAAETDLSGAALNVFQQAFWIADASGSNASRVIEVRVDGKLACRLPYMLERGKFGILKGGGHHWTHLNGVSLSYQLGETLAREVVRRAIAELPEGVSWAFQSDHDAPHATIISEEFARAGFTTSKRLTFSQRPDQLGIFLPEATDELGLYAKHSGKTPKGIAPSLPVSDDERRMRRTTKRTRESIREAHSKLDVASLEPREFSEFYEFNLLAQGETVFSPIHVAERLLEKAAARGQGRVFSARLRAGDGLAPNIVAAIACIWDTKRYYLWMMGVRKGGDTRGDPPGAMKLLIACAIRDAHRRGLTFDTDGVCGTPELYRHRLHIPNEEYHLVFTRDAPHVFLARRALRLLSAPKKKSDVFSMTLWSGLGRKPVPVAHGSEP